MIPVLLFDLTATQPALGSKRHGGGIYGEIVLRRIIERKREVEVFYDSRLWLNPEIKTLLEDNGIITYDIKDLTLDEIVRKSNCDRVYTCGENPMFRQLEFPLKYYTLHGMRELETPLDSFYYKYKHPAKEIVKFRLKQLLYSRYKAKHINRVTRMVESGTRFVVVSNHTAHSIKSYMPQYAGIEIPVFYSPSTIREDIVTRTCNDKYFLIVSANRWEKNGLRAIMALDRLFSSPILNGYKAVLSGASTPDIYKYKFKNLDRFEFKGYVDDHELNQLYHDAYCLIYPSLNEGFGYPPLEAMHYGVPVIASPFTSIPEVCGDAALYFNPFSVEEIMARIIAITSPALHSEMSENAVGRYNTIKERQVQDLDKLIDYIYG